MRLFRPLFTADLLKLESVKPCTLLISMLASAILAATPGYCIEPIREMPAEDEKKAAPDDDNQILADIREGLRSRNSKEPVSLRSFRFSSPKIQVRDLSALKGLRRSKRNSEFKRTYPSARGYVEAWLPGYSKNGRSAVLRALIGPTPHGSTATYMLTKKNGRWTVVWRKVVRYL